MSDISKVTVDTYDTGNTKGYIIAPEVEEKRVFIPSPPTDMMVPIARNAFLYLTEMIVTPDIEKIDALKSYVADNKVTLICPESREIDDLVDCVIFARKNVASLNIKKDIKLIADQATLDFGEEVIEALEDEDIEVGDITELNL